MADTNKAEQRLNKLVDLIWKTRWVSEESDYQDLVGMAAAIRSGNFDGIDKAIADEQANAAAAPDAATKVVLNLKAAGFDVETLAAMAEMANRYKT